MFDDDDDDENCLIHREVVRVLKDVQCSVRCHTVMSQRSMLTFIVPGTAEAALRRPPFSEIIN